MDIIKFSIENPVKLTVGVVFGDVVRDDCIYRDARAAHARRQ